VTTNNVRIERDSLGEVRVPTNALYAAQTQRAIESFPVSGLRPYPAFIWSMAVIKRAAAKVNHRLGHLDGERAQAIMQAADEVIAGRWNDQFVVDPFQAGAGTSHNMNTNEVIANRANQILGFALDAPDKPVHPNDHVNMAQSTNDTIPTAIRLGCLHRLAGQESHPGDRPQPGHRLPGRGWRGQNRPGGEQNGEAGGGGKRLPDA
jgi:fumarate hydratase class II